MNLIFHSIRHHFLFTLALALLVLLPNSPLAHAQPRNPGVQKPPPAPPNASAPTLIHDLGQRKAIRGCHVGDSCHGAIQEALLEFELEAFPKSESSSPWVNTESMHGHAAVRNRGRGPDRVNAASSRGKRTRVSKPSELRPDLPWLDTLKMPDIPIHWDHSIIKFLEFYRYNKRGRNIMRGWLRSQKKYRAMMLRKLRKHKLPEALLYISMIESSYSPHEYSRVGASGLWQFMPAAGHIYGLAQNRWIDERNDPDRSTDAVMYYFSDLYARFGDWDLAMAAFNAGYGAVIKSIAKYNTNDYWHLISLENGLPWGTAHYVPKFLATAIVGNNLDVFGFTDIKYAQPVVSDEVTVPKSVKLSIVAQAAGAKLDTIKFLNPQLRRGRTPPNQKNYVVRIPVGAREKFSTKFAQLRGDWDDADAYLVRHGERFEDIATTHGISRNKLRKLNGLASEAEVRGGMFLVVPKVSEEKKATNRLRAQEDLYRSGVPKADKGESMLIPLPDLEFKVKGRKRYFYRVVSGDTQGGIAEAFDVDRFDLATWNALDPEAHLHPRMVLQVWPKSSFSAKNSTVAVLDPARLQLVQVGSTTHLDEAEKRVGRKRIAYAPKRPESLESIGKKFGLSRYDLARINQRAPSSIISPDESILVYKVVNASQSDRAAAQQKSARKANRKKAGTKGNKKPGKKKSK